MKDLYSKASKVISGGRNAYEHTDEFKAKKEEIVKEVMDKYLARINVERMPVKKWLLRVKMNIEIRKAILKFSSYRNLHSVK
jgi:hypothetical protein